MVNYGYEFMMALCSEPFTFRRIRRRLGKSINTLAPPGIEPRTLALLAPRSNQLSYEAMADMLHIRYLYYTRLALPLCLPSALRGLFSV